MPGKLTPGTPSIWNGTSRPCQWIELSSSKVLVTAMRARWPSFSRISGPGTVPLAVTAWPALPSIRAAAWPMVSLISSPLSAAGDRPGSAARAQAGSSPAAPKPKAPRSRVRRSKAVITDPYSKPGRTWAITPPMSRSTPATIAFSKAGVAFDLHTYDYDPGSERVGLQAAEALGEDPARVLKPLIVML